MSRQKGGALLSTLKIERMSGVPLYRQLESAIRQLVLSGDLAANSRLPATRQLSRDRGVSRLTVKNVYEQLIAEGFLNGKPGAGTFVAEISTSEMPPEVAAPLVRPATHHPPSPFPVSRVGSSKATTRLGGVHAFRPGIPALDRFPRRAWAAAHSRVMRTSGKICSATDRPAACPS